MKNIKWFGLGFLVALVAIAATTVTPGLRISQYPNTNRFGASDLLIIAVTNQSTNFNMKMSDFQAQITATNRFQILTNGVAVGIGTNIDFMSGVTGYVSGATFKLGSTGGSGGGLSGTTNTINLSVQAVKLPSTNFVGIDAGWPFWETIFYETNAEGIRTNLSGSWQSLVPPDYATNSLQLLINYSLLGTNGPNTSNVIFGASVNVIRSGTTNNVHTNQFGTVVWGTNNWIAKYDGTNICTNLVINLTNFSLLMPQDLFEVQVQRDAFNDTYGGAVSVHGLQLYYTRP